MEKRCMQCMQTYEDEYEVCPWCGFIEGTKAEEVYHINPGYILRERYTMGVVVGVGGFGITYKAWDNVLDKVVAIKEYFPASLVNRLPGGVQVEVYSPKQRKNFQDGLRRFLDEAKSTAKFSKHPNIVNVYDFFESNGTAYIVMEYLDGLSLKEFLNQNGGRIDTDTAITILLSVMEALKAVHAKGFLHRDISPDNIYMCLGNTVKLIDFGAARFSTGESEKTLSIVLKQGYAPPEQYSARSKQGPWTDIYALGATMYRAITGVVPDESSNRVIEDIVKRPKELVPDIPDYIDVSLMVAMSLTPELRFQNIKQFEDAILNKKKVVSIEEDLRKRKKKRVISIAVASAVLLIAGTGVFGFYRQKQQMAELEPTQITICVEAKEGEVEQEQARVENALTEFRTVYPQVEVSVVCISDEAYDAYLAERQGTEEFPTVFESTDVSETILEDTIDISKVMKLVVQDDYYFLDEYSQFYPAGKQIPIGMTIPVTYCNTGLLESGESSIGSEESFLAGDCSVLSGDITMYRRINSAMPGQYEIDVNEQDKVVTFTDTFSVSAVADKRQQEAGKRVIYYLLGEQAQDAYYIQNSGALPLNKNEFDVYTMVNNEFIFLKEEIQEYTLQDTLLVQ